MDGIVSTLPNADDDEPTEDEKRDLEFQKIKDAVDLIPPIKMRVIFQIKNIKVAQNSEMSDIAAEFQILKFDKKLADEDLDRKNPEFNIKATHKVHFNKILKEGIKNKIEEAQHYMDHPTK